MSPQTDGGPRPDPQFERFLDAVATHDMMRLNAELERAFDEMVAADLLARRAGIAPGRREPEWQPQNGFGPTVPVRPRSPSPWAFPPSPARAGGAQLRGRRPRPGG